MQQFIKTLSLLLFVAGSINATAQSQEDMKRWTDFMTPSSFHKMLAAYDGEWSEDISMWMAPGAPPQKFKSGCVTKMIMDGRYQQSEHHGDFGGMPFEGISMTAYDNNTKKVISTWIDNMGTGLTYMEGTWDEATKTISMKGMMTDPMSGEQLGIREVLVLVDNNTQRMEQYSIAKDGKESKTMEIVFKRK